VTPPVIEKSIVFAFISSLFYLCFVFHKR